MSLYVVSLQPLIIRLSIIASSAKQCWYADDAKQWWDELEESGPGLGYFPNSKKSWLIVKPCEEEAARELLLEWLSMLLLKDTPGSCAGLKISP